MKYGPSMLEITRAPRPSRAAAQATPNGSQPPGPRGACTVVAWRHSSISVGRPTGVPGASRRCASISATAPQVKPVVWA